MSFLSSFYPQPVIAGTTDGTFAEGNHTHELDELEATSISVGKVLTATGSNTASWEDPAATGDVEEAPEDGIIYGRKDADWVDITEPANLQVRRGTAVEVAAITPLEGEPVWETDTKLLKLGDGSTVGGEKINKYPLDGRSRYLVTGVPQAGNIFVCDEVEDRRTIPPRVKGDTRGSGAVDLQMSRTLASQVATANFSSILSGTNNTIEALATYSTLCTSLGSTITNAGIRSFGVCCNSKTISGSDSFSVNSNISGNFSFAVHATADRRNMFACGSTGTVTGFSSTERAQSVQFILKGRTTNATPTELIIHTSTFLTIPTNVALFGVIEICAIEETGATEAAHYLRKFAIQNINGETSLIGNVTTIGTDEESDSSYDVSITADNNVDYLKVVVTGDSSKTLRWVATIRGTEMDIA